VIIAASAEKILKPIRPAVLMLCCLSWVFLIVFAQLLLSPHVYHNGEYRAACQKLKTTMAAQNDNYPIMADVIFSFVFPNRAFVFDRDFSIMNKETGITLEDYCRRYNIRYVLWKTKKLYSDNLQLSSQNFTNLDYFELSRYTGTILRPGREIKYSYNLLKFQPR
jgi:hypothetical protein